MLRSVPPPIAVLQHLWCQTANQLIIAAEGWSFDLNSYFGVCSRSERMESQKDRGSSSPERDPQGSGWAVWKEFLRQKKIFLLFYKWRCVTAAEEAAPEALSGTISSGFYFLTANCWAATQTNTPAPPAFCPHLRAYWRGVPVTRVSLNPVSKHGRNVSPGGRRRSWAHKGVCELGIAPCVWECGVTAGRGG